MSDVCNSHDSLALSYLDYGFNHNVPTMPTIPDDKLLELVVLCPNKDCAKVSNQKRHLAEHHDSRAVEKESRLRCSCLKSAVNSPRRFVRIFSATSARDISGKARRYASLVYAASVVMSRPVTIPCRSILRADSYADVTLPVRPRVQK